jgi:hypothetical protein
VVLVLVHNSHDLESGFLERLGHGTSYFEGIYKGMISHVRS